jgi:hypothetical protein
MKKFKFCGQMGLIYPHTLREPQYLLLFNSSRVPRAQSGKNLLKAVPTLHTLCGKPLIPLTGYLTAPIESPSLSILFRKKLQITQINTACQQISNPVG